MLNDGDIISFRASDGNTVRLEYRSSLPSAVELAKEYARSGKPDRYAVFTERQTAVSSTLSPLSEGESEQGLYLSCVLRPSIFPSQAGIVGPLSALAFANALEEHTTKKLGVGWVSDIYCDGRRIGCCSVEGKLDDLTSYEYMIVTFSVRLDQKNFPPRLTDMVRKVFEDQNLSVPMIMAKTVLNKFFAIYREIKNPGKHIEAYANKFALAGKKIRFLEDGKKKPAKVVGVDKTNLALIIETKDSKKIRITSPSGVIIPDRI